MAQVPFPLGRADPFTIESPSNRPDSSSARSRGSTPTSPSSHSSRCPSRSSSVMLLSFPVRMSSARHHRPGGSHPARSPHLEG